MDDCCLLLLSDSSHSGMACRSLELERLAREAEALREQIREEQQRRQSRVADLAEQVAGVASALC